MMAVALPAFTPLEDSLFLTLYAMALDSRRPQPILGEATADQVVRTTDYQYDKLDIKTNLVLNVSLRAKKLDQVASAFLTRHPGRARSRSRRRGFPTALRRYHQLAARSTAWSRTGTIVVHYRF